MHSFRTLLASLAVTLSFSALAQTPPSIVWVDEPYAPGPELYDRYQKQQHDYEILGETGFFDAPLNYADPSGPSMKIFYRLPKPLDAAKPTVLYFYGGLGGISLFASLEDELPAFNIIYMDQRGTGFSRPDQFSQLQNPDYFSSEFIARDAAALVRRLGVDKVTIYGHSYGTVLGTIFGSLFPELTRAIVLEGVVFSGELTLWEGRHRMKLLQKYFDRLPKELQEKILSLSSSGKVPSDWYSLIGQQIMYSNFYETELRKELDQLFALEETERINKIKRSLDRSYKGQDTLFFGSYMFHHIACQELSANELGSWWGAEFVNGKLQPKPSKFSDLCLTIPGMETHLGRTYYSTNYPLKVPVTYFQGTWDGATIAPNAIHHYKQVPQSFAQLVLVRKSGHSPMAGCLSPDDEIPSVTNCPSQEALQSIVNKAFLGQPLSPEELKAAAPDGNWVMTKKN